MNRSVFSLVVILGLLAVSGVIAVIRPLRVAPDHRVQNKTLSSLHGER